MFAPNERIAPFPNFPQPMFERPTPSCKHTHKSTNFLEALPVDARQSRKKDRIHAKASPNTRCSEDAARSSTGCANLKKQRQHTAERAERPRPFSQNSDQIPRRCFPARRPKSGASEKRIGCREVATSRQPIRLIFSFGNPSRQRGSGLPVRCFSIRSRRAPGHRKPTKRLSRPLPSPRRSAYREPSRHRPPHKRREYPSGNSCR